MIAPREIEAGIAECRNRVEQTVPERIERSQAAGRAKPDGERGRADDLDNEREAHDPTGKKYGLLNGEGWCAVSEQELVAQGVRAGAAA